MVTYFPQKIPIFCICLPKMGKMDIHIWDFLLLLCFQHEMFFYYHSSFFKKIYSVLFACVENRRQANTFTHFHSF